MDSHKQCVHSECRQLATAVLTYDHAGQAAFLHKADQGPVHSAMVLCTKHADSLRVPRGWSLDDQRGPAIALFGAYAS